jgi:anti-sigma28 factor (negative regulator of flagellin synthesis)
MPFRVGNKNLVNAPLGPAGPATKAAGTASAPPAAADELQLSKSAGTLSRVAQNDAANRSQRISQLAAAGRSGAYRVESAAVSKAIVDQAIGQGDL